MNRRPNARPFRLLAILMLTAIVAPIFPGGPGSAGPAAATAAESRLVLAFYYPWFDDGTWNSGKLADRPAQPYNSDDPGTIARQVDQARNAGIDAFIVAWWGPGNRTDANFGKVLDAAQARGFRATVYFEPDSPTIHSQGDVVNQLRYVLRNRADHPAFLRSGGKPVIFVWRPTAIPTAAGQSPIDAWQAVLGQVDPTRSAIWIGEGDNFEYLLAFDGIHPYSIAWSSNPAGQLASYGQRTRSKASQLGAARMWVATAMPGYDDTRSGRPDGFARPRGDGAYYTASFRGAIASQPDWIVITSFNEWVEGSQIEPSAAYGDRYLNLTRDLVREFKKDAAPAPAPASAGNGRFYTQAAGGGRGYWIRDEGGVAFWSEFRRLGGEGSLGYPSTRRATLDGFAVQGTQKMILQWRPEIGQVYFANVFDMLHDRGFGGWLEAHRATPPPFDTSADRGLSWEQIKQRHWAFLDVNPAIKAVYWADSDPLQHFGLPMSYKDYGNVFVVRAQRAVFQQWRTNTPWASAGQVVIANGGDIAKELGLFGDAANPE
ncbi:MAG: glycoside hydrolase family 99-like domain-containing protein [Chloroflexi bacterium]|nr:glycoside hydrolase family 99-like domain-containing protein [Chloroflexota bacterium]